MKEVNYPGLPTPKEFLDGKNLIGILGMAEAEEMLEILLNFSIKANKWISPDFDEIVEAINERSEILKENEEKKRRNTYKRLKHQKNVKKWGWLYKLIGKELAPPEYEEITDIFSVMPVNPKTPVVGLKYLYTNDYIKIINECESDVKRHYAVLTQKTFEALK